LGKREKPKKLFSQQKTAQTTKTEEPSTKNTEKTQEPNSPNPTKTNPSKSPNPTSSTTNNKSTKQFSQKKQAQTVELQEPAITVSLPETASTEESTAKPTTTTAAQATETIETYPLNEPYAYAKIVKTPSRGNITYKIEEPELDKTDTLNLQRLTTILSEVLELKITELKSKKAAREYLLKKCDEILAHYNFKLTPETKNKLLYYVVRDNLGLGKIDPFMHDSLIEDVSCDGINVPVYVWHRKYESIPTNVRFETAEELDDYALRLAYLCGSHVSIAQPMLDASLPDGSRLNLTYGSEITRRGSTFTIRKFKLDPFTVTDIVSFNTMSREMAAYFWYAVENRVSILVAGGIAAGKTTMLNCLSMFIKPDLKIVSIEDTPELNLPHENWIPATTRTHFGMVTGIADITLFDLLKASLRQRPDYIIVGEIRGAEAFTLFQAVSTGHLGMSTIHAESVEAAVYRLESEPMNIPRTLIAGVDLILVQKRVEHNGKPVRKTIATSEIVGLDPRSGEILTNEVYKWNSAEDTFDFTGRSYILERIADKKGISIEEANEEIQRRAKIIEWMSKQDVRNYKQVSDIIRSYYENPESILKEAAKHE
jgi:flagellar protein FlaI